MKILPLFKYLMAFAAVIALTRAVIGADGFSLYEILVEVQAFDFGFDDIQYFVDYYKNGGFQEYAFSWDYNLTGFVGFLQNLTNYLINLWDMVAGTFTLVFRTIFGTLTDIVLLFVKVLQFVLNVLGFDVDFISDGGWRGGR